MNDGIILYFFMYLVIASSVMGFIPDEFFSGSVPNQISLDDEYDPVSYGDNWNFAKKVIVFMFVPIVINGVPTILGWFIQLFHLLIAIFTSFYFLKMIRGVS